MIDIPPSNWPEQAAAHYTHDQVLSMLMRLLPNRAGLSALDLPCGAGALSARMAATGLNVTSVDIEATEPFRHDPARRIIADANQALPFPDNHFDLVVTVEGIEHLESPTGFLRECARITRAGGTLIVSTPNVDSMRSRTWAFLRGHSRYFGPQGDSAKDSGHLHPIDMIFFRGAAAKVGLEIIDLSVNEIKRSFVRQLFRPWLTRRLPIHMRGDIPYYGDVMIYGLRKPTATTGK